MNKNVFLTGGSGFVGKYIIDNLNEYGYTVKAMSRSKESSDLITSIGATPVQCSLHDIPSLVEAIRGCDIVIHCAAKLETNSQSIQELYKDNVEGTENIFNVSKKENIKVFIFISTEGVIMNGEKVVNADEETPFPPIGDLGWYNQSKALSEQYILDNKCPNGPKQMKSVIIRLPMVWGKGDNVLKFLVGLANSMKWFWIGGGSHYVSVCHVMNAANGIRLAIEKAENGDVYFLSDGEPVQYRSFFTDRFRKKGVSNWKLKMTIPVWFAWMLVWIMAFVWKVFGLKGLPLLTKTGLLYSSKDFTINDQKARKKLSYKNIVSYKQGMDSL
eukprot:gene5792-7205_t